MWTMTREKADQVIFNHMYEGYAFGGDDVNLVAAEIMLRGSQADHTVFANPSNHQLVMDIINEAGGVRQHQSKVTFIMKVGN
jgi:hypothetical protein